MKRTLSGYWAALAAAWLLCQLAPPAAAQQVEQERVEAAMTLQILTFTVWPEDHASADRPLRLGLLGGEATADAFRQLVADPRYAERYELVPLAAAPSDATLASLQAIFFAEDDPTELPRLLRRLHGLPVVTLAAHEGFLEQGGMVNLVKRQRRLGFEVQLINSRAQGIQYRAKLLRLATRVVDEP